MSESGLYVTVEGIDGSGTTSVSSALARRFDAAQTAEPSDLWLGEVTREAFEDRDVADLSRFYLFMADRLDHRSKVIEPALEQGETVISDRGADSTRAYQFITSGLTDGFIEMNLDKALEADLTIWLDAPVEDAADRMGGDDAFENRDLQERVAARYRTVYEQNQDRIVRIDASQPLGMVIDEAAEIIKTHER